MVMNHESVKMKQQKRPNSLNDTGSQLQFFTIYRLILSYMWQANSSKPTQLISIGHQRLPGIGRGISWSNSDHPLGGSITLSHACSLSSA